jgi:RNA polymerase sigma factor for flagellar operon FliA
VATKVWKRAPTSLDRDELVSIAYLGLVRAAQEWPAYCQRNSYDPERVEYFAPYAERRVRGAIMDELRRSDWVKRSTREKIKQLVESGHDQGATSAELSARTGLSAQEVQVALAALQQRPVSLYAEGVEYSGTASDDTDAMDLLQKFTLAVGSLSKVEQVVLALHYFEGLELRVVARVLGLTESRASRLHTDAVLRVHAVLLEAAGASF